MGHIARYAKATAEPGQGDRLAELLLQAADGVRKAPGCDLYIVNRVPGEPETIWVTELWESQRALDGALEIAKRDGGELMAEVMQIAAEFSRIDLEPIGGIGLDARSRGGWEQVALDEVENQATAFGLGAIQEMRSPVEPLGLERTGITLQRILPHQRQSFGHVHANAEETYIVLAGSGTLRIEDDEVTLAPRHAVRVAPTLTRAFEAGSDGLEYLAVGPRHRGDGDMTPNWWGETTVA